MSLALKSKSAWNVLVVVIKVRADRSLTIWVDATIDQFRFYPESGPCEFRLSKIELLVPTEEESRYGRESY